MSKKPRIAIAAQFPYDVLGKGSAAQDVVPQATWLPQLAMEWAKQTDFEIHWYILEHKGRETLKVQKWGQWFHRIPTSSVTAGMLAMRLPQRIAYRRMFRRHQPDLLHVWGTENLYGAGLHEFQGPSILSMQGVIHAIHPHGGLPGWRWRFFKHWETISLKRATMVTCESEWGIRQVRKIEPNLRTRRIEYGVHPEFYDVEWAPDPGRPELLVAGGLNTYKGTDILIRMLRENRKRNWKIVFAGDGDLRPDLETLGASNIETPGMITSQELRCRMARAWFLVHPSRADTSPNVVKEARVIGLPVVGSPNGGHAEYIDHEKDGLIVESEDPGQWFDAIERLSSNFEKVRIMGSVRHEWFRSHFKPEKTAQSFLKLYDEILKKR